MSDGKEEKIEAVLAAGIVAEALEKLHIPMLLGQGDEVLSKFMVIKKFAKENRHAL